MGEPYKPTPKEARPDGQWFLDREKDILAVTRTKKGRNYHEHVNESEYTKSPDDYGKVPVYIADDDAKIVIEPYHLQVFEMFEPSGQTGQRRDQIAVGIKDGQAIHYIGFLRGGSTQQFFFENDKPGDFAYGQSFTWGWPEARPQMIDIKTRAYFRQLVEMVPGVSQSLTRCLDLLAVPGPEHGNPGMASSLPIFRIPPQR
jgi:hypothetical protein